MKTALAISILLLLLSAGPTAAQPLMSPASDAQLRYHFPLTNDRDLSDLFARPDLLLYTDREMPGAYQAGQGSFTGVHSPSNNPAANPDPHGHANGEFPWARPAGTDGCKNLSTFRFIALPRSANGVPWPIAWYRMVMPEDDTPIVQWAFPVGTTVGEVLLHRGPDGNDYAFEVRTRVRHKTYWDVNAYRPFASPAELAARIKELRPAWEANQSLAAAVASLKGRQQLVAFSFSDRQPRKSIIRQSAAANYLPAMNDAKLVAELLVYTPFKNVHGQPWLEDKNQRLVAHAPSASDKWNIVPAGYTACAVEVSAKSCNRCHETTAMRATDFAVNGTGPGLREWYGHVRGSDRIFSFHPFDPSCISRNGFSTQAVMRPALVKAGVVDRYDSRHHPASVYSRLK